ncbi:hypothetical protein DY000_02033980 [Brassica cretica]|uniref:F-box domain-containing protein n=1 Tax=Brassica cretica TaxID=69181 RepID=A0ABQ7DVE5_BRACR|nr:hypothetical protein DY000_02033980 [Brassica cretica]
MPPSSTANLYRRILLLIKKRKKKKKKKPSPELPQTPQQSTPISLLPDDLLLTCFARISRSYYPTLSLVSKRFRSLLSSPELYETRSLIGRTESCLYLCLRFPPDPNTRWFTLCRKPEFQTLANKKKSSGNILVPVSVLNAPPVDWTTLVAVGPYIYAICGHVEKAPCSNVPFLDCRTHTWLEAPSLRLAYTDSEHDGKMYLAGNGEDPTSLNCIEVFNTKTRTWKPVPPGKRELHGKNMEGKMIVASVNKTTGEKGLAFKPKERTGELLGSNTDWDSPCMIENIAYYYRSCSGEFEWFDTKNDNVFGKLQGLEGLPKFAGYSCVKLVEHGGKMLVLWDMYSPASGFREEIIWCAEIKLERRSCEEIRGEVEWFDAVLKVPKSYEFMYAISCTV